MCDCYCFVSLSYGDMCSSAVCHCGMSWSESHVFASSRFRERERERIHFDNKNIPFPLYVDYQSSKYHDQSPVTVEDMFEVRNENLPCRY